MIKPPVFLDRDGTLIVEKDFLKEPAQVSLEAGVLEGLALLQHEGHPLIVVSNQSGIGRGKLSEEDARNVNARADHLLREGGIAIMAWYFCPHAPDSHCSCRKPLPGMAQAASREWGIGLPGCYVIGDKKSDVELADVIGGTGILLTSGHGRSDLTWALDEGRPVFGKFFEAAAFIGQREHLRTSQSRPSPGASKPWETS